VYLIYTDETGTNKNSKISLYGGLVVHESKVLKFEMQIIEIIQEFLGVSNMLEAEVHFTEIFNYIYFNKKPSKPNKLEFFNKSILPLIKDKNKKDIVNFINELFQLISKIDIPFIFSFINKNDEFHKNHYLGEKEISFNAYAFKAFINGVDRYLSKKQEMGLLVADDFYNQIPKRLQKLSIKELISDEVIKKNPHIKEIIYKRVLAESLVWKSSHLKEIVSSNSIAPLKYKFESNSFNLLDNINFVSSKDSIINQIADILLYVIRKIKEYELDRELYKSLKEFCENEDIKQSIEFLYSMKTIQEVKIILNNSKLEIEFLPERYIPLGY